MISVRTNEQYENHHAPQGSVRGFVKATARGLLTIVITAR